MKNLFASIYNSPVKLFVCFWVTSILLYGLSFRAGFYEDIVSYMGMYTEKNFWEFINLHQLSLYQGCFAFLYMMIAFFGTNPLFWFLVYTGLHALTAYYAYQFFLLLYRFIGWRHPQGILFAGCCLFLVSPLATEVVIWKACGHYFLSVLFLLMILRNSLLFLKYKHKKYPVFIAFIYFISIFFLEIFYLVPLLILLLLVALRVADKINSRQFRSGILQLFLPLCILFAIYSILLKTATGNWIGHGNGSFLSLLQPAFALEMFNKYFARIFLMDYFLPEPYRQMIYKIARHPVSMILCALGCLGLAVSIFNLKVFGNKFKAILLLFALGVVCCVVVLPTWFYEGNAYIGSRYFYLPALFLLPASVSCLAYLIRSFRFKGVLFALYLIGSLAGTGIIVYRAYAATRVYNHLIYHYPARTADTVILLNLPVMYKGYTMIPSGDPSNFNDHLKILTKAPASGIIYDVAGYNMMTPDDGAHVLVMDSLHIKVAPNHYGSWWWNKTFGAANYENSLYTFTVVDDGFRYILKLKRKPGKGTLFLYQSGRRWKQVDLSQINTWQW